MDVPSNTSSGCVCYDTSFERVSYDTSFGHASSGQELYLWLCFPLVYDLIEDLEY